VPQTQREARGLPAIELDCPRLPSYGRQRLVKAARRCFGVAPAAPRSQRFDPGDSWNCPGAVARKGLPFPCSKNVARSNRLRSPKRP
jgi:hypothetical protein